MAVTAPPQTCASTGPVAHCAPMSGPGLRRRGGLERRDDVSVDCVTTLIVMFGFFGLVRRDGGRSALVRAGCGVAPEPHRQADLAAARRRSSRR